MYCTQPPIEQDTKKQACIARAPATNSLTYEMGEGEPSLIQLPRGKTLPGFGSPGATVVPSLLTVWKVVAVNGLAKTLCTWLALVAAA